MTWKTICVSAAAVGLIFASAAQAELNFEDARGIWLLDEGSGDKIKDSSDNGNDGERQGGEWVDGREGRPALSLNGNDDRVIIPDSESLYIDGAWTITAWIFVNNAETSYGHILAKRPHGVTVANYAFRTSNNGTGWEAYFANNGWKGAWGKGSVKKGVWLYMTATYDGEGTIRIYENGVEIGFTGGLGPPAPRNDTPVNIGGWTDNTSETLNGMLSEVALFSAALTTDDMQTLMNEGLTTLLSVDPRGKLAATWADVKTQ